MSRGGPSQGRSRRTGEDALAERERAAVLAEFYGALLTDHQRELVQLYLTEDLSLGEIAARDGVSRQAVHDLLRRSIRAMESFEARLAFAARFERRQGAARRLGEIVRSWMPRLKDDPNVAEALDMVRALGEDEG